jgi:antitoxin MazE
MVSKVQKWGDSLGVRIPNKFAEEVGLSEESVVELSVEHGRIVVARARSEWQLSDLVSKISPANTHRELGWGKAEGTEAC